jgi:hypothetical protein
LNRYNSIMCSLPRVFHDGAHDDGNTLDEVKNESKVNCMDRMEEEFLKRKRNQTNMYD